MPVPPAQAAAAAFLARLSGVEARETPISAVFCGTDTVWKLKKAVDRGFLDFTAVEDRRRFLDREIELNAPHVPGLYRDVVAVTGGDALELGGSGPVVDWVLRMARVPDADLLDRMAAEGRLVPALLVQLADAVAAMHADQTPCGASDPVGQLRRVAAENAVAAHASGLDAAAVEGWRAEMEAALDRVAPVLEARAPLIRRAHGDLHLGNLVLWRGRPAPFDALEFDEALATIDPGYDLAFLLMDLERRVSRAAANVVLNRYVARTGDAGLVAALPPFLSLRAMVRAQVEASAALLERARDLLHPVPPVLLAVGGLMGSGKSTLARALAPVMGAAPGALVVRSDEVRKRLAGVAPEQPLPPVAYTAEANDRVADAVLDAARQALAGGHAVVADGTFLDPAFRARIAATARETGVPFLGVWLDAPLAELERRVAARRNDASDAGIDVLRAAARTPPAAEWVRVDALDQARAERQVRARLDLL